MNIFIKTIAIAMFVSLLGGCATAININDNVNNDTVHERCKQMLFSGSKKIPACQSIGLIYIIEEPSPHITERVGKQNIEATADSIDDYYLEQNIIIEE